MADDEEHVHGFGFEIPPGLVGGLRQRHDRRHMQALAARNRKDAFLDSLDEEGLRALKYILSGDNAEDVLAYNQRTIGEIDVLLRRVLSVDPDEPTPTADDLSGE